MLGWVRLVTRYKKNTHMPQLLQIFRPFRPMWEFQLYAQKLAKETVTLVKPVTPRGRILDIYNPKNTDRKSVV